MSLYDIQNPEVLKTMSPRQLDALAEEIRSFLVTTLSKTGGHLSSNLGVVELTIAMHVVFNSPKDKFIFDVGHQSYVHKILTGRADKFGTLRKRGGLSGFQKCKESEHDPWEAGHSSTSLSAALGFAIARDLKGEDGEVVAVIGDGALTSGMAMEALNDLGTRRKKVIIILNDNNMSISPNRSGLERGLTRMRSSRAYRTAKNNVKQNLHDQKAVLNGLTFMRDTLKHGLVDGGIFSDFNLDYLGPVNGHDTQALINALETAKEHDGPIVVHVQTRKGKGYAPAQNDKVGNWHGVPPFDIATGRFKHQLPANEKNWSEVISDTLGRLAKEDKTICAITPAMANGSKLVKFAHQFPDRFFDCGIAEEHAITMASAMAKGGLKPFVSIYSSFLQRAYDQISHDLARMETPVVVGVDRAGLVGEDGETHQGIYDIAFLRTVPNVIIAQPKDGTEAQHMLYTAFESGKPFFLRYPKGSVPFEPVESFKELPIGKWETTIVGQPEQIVIAYGPDVDRIIEKARINGLGMMVINARFLKPIDTALLDTLVKENLPITVYETDVSSGGLSSAILEALNDKVDVVGLDSKFIPHGSVAQLRKEEGVSLEDLFTHLEKHAR